MIEEIIDEFDYEREFDIEYAKYILENNHVFMAFMEIIIKLYEGMDVYIVPGNGIIIYSAATIEAYYKATLVTRYILKVNTTRYGYNSTVIELDFLIMMK